MQSADDAQLAGNAVGVKLSLVRALSRAKIGFQFINELEIPSFNPAFAINHFVCSSPSTVALVKKHFGGRYGVNVALILCPNDFPLGTEDNDKLMAAATQALDGRDLVFTDSELSRYTLDSFYLNRTRVDVQVLTPEPGLLTVPEGEEEASMLLARWTYDSGKKDPVDHRLVSPGLNWSRDMEITEAADGISHSAPLTQIELEENEATVSRCFKTLLPCKPLAVGVMGHKLTFIDELAASISRTTGSKVCLDEWKYLSGPSDKVRAANVLQESEVVIGEWARPNNVWLQNNADADTRLIVRAHRYEVTTDFPRQIDMDRFEAAVVIVPWVGRKLVQDFGWPAEKLVYIPNFVNNDYFRRPKLEGANFTLGIAGVTPHLKRLDLALDLLAALRRVEPRFNLRVRGSDPTRHPHWKTNSQMRDQWASIQARLRFDPLIRGGVHFDGEGRDMAAWFQQIGFILSTSDLEGSHVALAEGTVSGAIPVARRWPGIETLWPEEIIHDDFDDAVSYVLEHAEINKFDREAARYSGLKALDSWRVLEAWWGLLNGRKQEARTAFGDVDWEAPLYEPVPTRELW